MWDSEKYFIRTKRISLPLTDKGFELAELKNIQTECNKLGIRWFVLPIDPKKNKKFLRYTFNLLKEIDQIFINVLCIKDKKINFRVLNDSVKLIKKVARISPNGKDNFRLGLSTNICCNCPFFPFSYSSGDLSFSVALELTQEINRIIDTEKKLNLVELREKIIEVIVPQIDEINKIANCISKETNISFSGFDFSLAPVIEENGSILKILRRIGINDFGKSGTLYATAYLTNILKYFCTLYKNVGFSGVMYSLLEDFELCTLNNDNGVKLEEMIKLSTMCGCGIDMIPITEDTDDGKIKTAIMDIYGISSKLNKPLGVRFLPIPRTKSEGVFYTNFNENSDFIANTKVLSLSNNCIDIGELKKFEFLDVNIKT
jgi:uncharacterized protein (UPF0210 family)